jgi:hypothetical protein
MRGKPFLMLGATFLVSVSCLNEQGERGKNPLDFFRDGPDRVEATLTSPGFVIRLDKISLTANGKDSTGVQVHLPKETSPEFWSITVKTDAGMFRSRSTDPDSNSIVIRPQSATAQTIFARAYLIAGTTAGEFTIEAAAGSVRTSNKVTLK